MCKYFFLAFSHACGYIAKPRWQDCKEEHCYESIVSVALEVACAMSSGTGEDYSRDGRPIDFKKYLTSRSFLSLPSGVSAAVHGGQGTWIPQVVL